MDSFELRKAALEDPNVRTPADGYTLCVSFVLTLCITAVCSSVVTERVGG